MTVREITMPALAAGTRMHVLLVEPSARRATDLCRALRAAGIRVRWADGVDAAGQHLGGFRFDVVVAPEPLLSMLGDLGNVRGIAVGDHGRGAGLRAEASALVDAIRGAEIVSLPCATRSERARARLRLLRDTLAREGPQGRGAIAVLPRAPGYADRLGDGVGRMLARQHGA
ncbi:hypothetical protein [Roseobacter sp. HKCCA0434]|uniref:hypothetical protein n=1 Tax=Roseobacter sp. HKCCA0434 TaxID=3079297 RepID=UPI0029058C18|nr:hypothetical protein [Roseobacter sp. HKCCA0434]